MKNDFSTLIQFQPWKDDGKHVKVLTQMFQGITVDVWQMDDKTPYYQLVGYIPDSGGDDTLDVLLDREDLHKYPVSEHDLAHAAQAFIRKLRGHVIHGSINELHYKMTEAELLTAQTALKQYIVLSDHQYIHNDDITIGGKKIFWCLKSTIFDSNGHAVPSFLQKVTFTVKDALGSIERSITIKKPITTQPMIDVSDEFENHNPLIAETLGLDYSKKDIPSHD